MAENTPARSNAEVAQRFAELADYLDILGENPFKTRAYRNAVRTLEDLPEQITLVAAEDRLDELPGFGDAIQAKTKDILTTGTTKALEDARRKVPATVLELVGLPGIGSQTINKLYTQYKIDSLAALEAAIEEHRIQKLPGMGEKTEEKLRDAVERHKRYTKRMLLSEARELGGALADYLSRRPEVEQMTQAGSARRGVETVGDIDIVGTSRDRGATMKAFSELPKVERVLAQSDSITRLLLMNGIEADLKLASPGEFGALLHHFTGSREHNIKLRDMAERRGLKINEYGIWKDGEKLPVGDDENAIYEVLGLPIIPVPLRENRGEIEAAQHDKLPKLIEIADMRGDMHVHTTASDGKASIEEMALAAKARGYEYMALTDHSRSLSIANGLTPERLQAQIRQVREMSDKLGFQIFAGSECDIKTDGTMDFPDDLLGELDFVIGSIHSRFSQSEDEITARMIRAISNPHVDLIAHPTGRLLNQRDPYAVNIEQVIEAAALTHTALEINSSPNRLDLSDVHARMAHEAGVKIMINTDAHSVSDFDQMPYGITVAQRAWLEAGDVVNTLPLEKMRDWLKR